MSDMTQNIPTTIHYCWFGGNALGDDEQACVASWRTHCPTWKIKQWDESNFDVRCNAFVAGAYERKNWAFVSDYARFRVLYDEGGVYLDTDVELLRPLDVLLARAPYMGFERDADERAGVMGAVNAGLGMAFPPHHPFVKSVLDVYEHAEFPQEGNLGDYTVVEVVTSLLEQQGMKAVEGCQVVAGVTLLPRRYLDPMDRWTGDVDITPDTVSIHRYGASWVSRSAKLELSLVPKLIRLGLSKNRACALAKVLAVAVCFDVSRMRSFLGVGTRRNK